MRESRGEEAITRPASCPFCNGKMIDTLAKSYTVATLWRCRGCEETWTIKSLNASKTRLR